MLTLRPFQFLARALVADGTPRQLALGFAFGVLIGLVPKGNLIAVALMVLFFAVRVNLGIGMLTAFVFSWIGMLLDPLSHRLGLFLLTHPTLQSLWVQLYNMRFAPWTDFNNTVVLGSFLIGSSLFLPCYVLSRPILERYVSSWLVKLQQFRLVRLIWGLNVASKLS